MGDTVEIRKKANKNQIRMFEFLFFFDGRSKDQSKVLVFIKSIHIHSLGGEKGEKVWRNR